MARFTQRSGTKESQKWIQVLVNEKPEILNSQIRRNLNLPDNETIEWLSPLETDRYAEYRDEAFIERFGVKLEKMPLRVLAPERSSMGRIGQEFFWKAVLG